MEAAYSRAEKPDNSKLENSKGGALYKVADSPEQVVARMQALLDPHRSPGRGEPRGQVRRTSLKPPRGATPSSLGPPSIGALEPYHFCTVVGNATAENIEFQSPSLRRLVLRNGVTVASDVQPTKYRRKNRHSNSQRAQYSRRCTGIQTRCHGRRLVELNHVTKFSLAIEAAKGGSGASPLCPTEAHRSAHLRGSRWRRRLQGRDARQIGGALSLRLTPPTAACPAWETPPPASRPWPVPPPRPRARTSAPARALAPDRRGGRGQAAPARRADDGWRGRCRNRTGWSCGRCAPPRSTPPQRCSSLRCPTRSSRPRWTSPSTRKPPRRALSPANQARRE